MESGGGTEELPGRRGFVVGDICPEGGFCLLLSSHRLSRSSYLDGAVKSKDGNVISTYSSFSEGIREQ